MIWGLKEGASNSFARPIDSIYRPDHMSHFVGILATSLNVEYHAYSYKGVSISCYLTCTRSKVNISASLWLDVCLQREGLNFDISTSTDTGSIFKNLTEASKCEKSVLRDRCEEWALWRWLFLSCWAYAQRYSNYFMDKACLYHNSLF